MEINYWAILVSGVAALVLGSIWYGPIFGKKWMEITRINELDAVTREKMKKGVLKLYILQFVLVLFQVYVLARYVGSLPSMSGVVNSLWIWAGFVMPTIAGAVMWSGGSKRMAWNKFLIQAGYNLVLFIIIGLIIGLWR